MFHTQILIKLNPIYDKDNSSWKPRRIKIFYCLTHQDMWRLQKILEAVIMIN